MLVKCDYTVIERCIGAGALCYRCHQNKLRWFSNKPRDIAHFSVLGKVFDDVFNMCDLCGRKTNILFPMKREHITSCRMRICKECLLAINKDDRHAIYDHQIEGVLKLDSVPYIEWWENNKHLFDPNWRVR